MKSGKSKKRLVEAADICRLDLMTSVAMSPDEKRVAYTVKVVSKDKRKYFSHIHILNCDSGESRQFTFGKVSDREPVWSPDGKLIAFVSTRDKVTGIYIMSSDGGAERRIIEIDGAVMSLVWTPDSRELVYAFRRSDSHDIKDKEKKREAPLYRHITSLAYRQDGVGFFPKDRFHIWKLSLETGKTKQLTKGNHNDFMPTVSPDGRWIVFCSRRQEVVPPFITKLFLIPVNGGKERAIPTPKGIAWAPSFSPDSRTISFGARGNPEELFGVTNFHVWTVGIRGKPPARDLTPTFDRSINNNTVSDLQELSQSLPTWSSDGKRIYFIATDCGSSHIFYVPSTGGRPVQVTREKCHVMGFSLSGRSRKIAAIVSDLTTPCQLRIMPATGGGDSDSTVLANSNEDLLSKMTTPTTKEVWFKAKDGTDLQGWLVTPPKAIRRRRHPAILQIHGGPVVQYGFTFFHEMLYLASNGYVVLYTNPRGSTGRGESFASTIRHEWGTREGYGDLMDAADYLGELPFVDENRMGVTGGSYGGFMTNWVVGHTDRFRAAITQRSIASMASFVALANGGTDLGRAFGRYAWTDPEWYTRVSPLTYAENINTPLLIIHSENDLGPKIEQAEQLFTTLKLMKKKVEFLRFPAESHGLSRSGRPDRRIARLKWILRWFDRFLK
jgi:acylaminoacyl-peptidase